MALTPYSEIVILAKVAAGMRGTDFVKGYLREQGVERLHLLPESLHPEFISHCMQIVDDNLGNEVKVFKIQNKIIISDGKNVLALRSEGAQAFGNRINLLSV